MRQWYVTIHLRNSNNHLNKLAAVGLLLPTSTGAAKFFQLCGNFAETLRLAAKSCKVLANLPAKKVCRKVAANILFLPKGRNHVIVKMATSMPRQ
ncbi:hypothetical protein DPMN_118000, partial [Dreissena polymorpha]